MIDRRQFPGAAAGAGATLALSPELLRALQTHQQQRTIAEQRIPLERK